MWLSNNTFLFFFCFYTRNRSSFICFILRSLTYGSVRVSSNNFVILWGWAASLVEISFSLHIGFSRKGRRRLEEKPYPSLVIMITQCKNICNVIDYYITLQFYYTRKFNHIYFKTLLCFQNDRNYYIKDGLLNFKRYNNYIPIHLTNLHSGELTDWQLLLNIS